MLSHKFLKGKNVNTAKNNTKKEKKQIKALGDKTLKITKDNRIGKNNRIRTSSITHNISNIMGHSESSSERKIYNNKMHMLRN